MRKFKETLDEAIQKTCKRTNAPNTKVKGSTVPWWTDALKTMRKRANALRRRYQRTTGDGELREVRRNQYNKAKKDYQIHQHINKYISKNTSTSVHTPIHQYTHQYISTHTNTSVHTPAYQYTHQYYKAHTSISSHTSKTVHISVYFYTHQYISTHTSILVNMPVNLYTPINQYTYQYFSTQSSIYVRTAQNQ